MKLLICLLSMIVSLQAFAGGSYGTSEASAVICQQDKTICGLFNSLDLNPNGLAARKRGGERIMPFQFESTDKAFTVVVDRDADGKLVLLLKSGSLFQ